MERLDGQHHNGSQRFNDKPGGASIPGLTKTLAGIWLPLAVAVGCSSQIALILLVDHYLQENDPALVTIAVLDHLAHLATIVILLAPFYRYLTRWFIPGVIAGNFLLDLGHIPLIFGDIEFSEIASRPVTHSLIVGLPILLAAVIATGALRNALFGMIIGLLAHLYRDAATGGIPLLWPINSAEYEIGYSLYILSLVLTALWAVARFVRLESLGSPR